MCVKDKILNLLKNKKGELLYFESVWKIMLAVVVGAICLGCLLLLFKEVILPRITNITEKWFNWAEAQESIHLNMFNFD